MLDFNDRAACGDFAMMELTGRGERWFNEMIRQLRVEAKGKAIASPAAHHLRKQMETADTDTLRRYIEEQAR